MSTPVEPLVEARAAALGGHWSLAYDRFSAADTTSLTAADLEAMADAAWWTSRLDEAVALRQRAYARFAEAGDDRRAAYSSWFLYCDYLMFQGNSSLASGWLRRAERHLLDVPECIEHGFVLLAHVDAALARGAIGEALDDGRRALDLGRRARSPDLVAMALQTLGRARLAEGRAAEGMALLDEAMCSVLASELHPLFTGWIFCSALEAAFGLADLRRATEWSAAAVRWCDSLTFTSPYHGLCRVHRAEVMALEGSLADAEEESLRAADELLPVAPLLAGESFYAAGEVRRRRGDLPAAEKAFRRAHELGRDPQPGLALVRLAQGRTREACLSLRARLDEEGPPLTRCRVLAATVESAVAAGDAGLADAALRRLEDLSAGAAGSVLQATAETAGAAVHLSTGDHGRALRAAAHACRLWQELNMPYEAARARVLCAKASRAAGDEDGARLELEAAGASFRRLGARLDAAETDALLERAHPGGLSDREVEVLRLVATGRTNREVASELVLSEHTVSRHLQNIFAKLGVSSRVAATAFAFEHGLA